MDKNIIELIIALAILFPVIIIIFLAIRRFWLWYFKIDQRIELLRDIRHHLEQLNKNTN